MVIGVYLLIDRRWMSIADNFSTVRIPWILNSWGILNSKNIIYETMNRGKEDEEFKESREFKE